MRLKLVKPVRLLNLQIKMKFLVDENLPKGVAQYLTDKKFDVLKAIPGSSDEDIAALASKEKRVLLTLDTDFANILSYPPEKFSGIVCFRIRNPRIDEILRTLNHIIEYFDQDSIKGKLIIATANRLRIR